MDAGADDPERAPQGWFVDPFGIHEQRWISQGTPTALVRDGRTEAQDPPPDAVIAGPLIRAVPLPPTAPTTGPGAGGPADGPSRPLDLPPRPGTAGDRTPVAVTPGLVRHLRPRAGGVRTTPRRVVGTRWVALAFAAVWSLLLVGLLLTATTTTHLPDGHTQTQTVVSRDTGGVVAFAALLAVAVGATGAGLVRRLRADSETAGRAGYVIAGILCLLGVLSLASIGLALVVLAAALFVVARPMKRPRPLPGERIR